ncbi:MAG: class I tRNA ligase family protein [Thermoplasmata archaeon]
MMSERKTIGGTSPIELPPDNQMLMSISYSDLYNRLGEILFKNPNKKQIMSSGTTLSEGGLIIPIIALPPTAIKKTQVNYIQIKNLMKNITNGVSLISSDPKSVSQLDIIINNLFNAGKIYVDGSPKYYCDFCKTSLSKQDIHYDIGENKILYAKIKIDNNIFFIFYGPEDVVLSAQGLSINSYDIFYIQNEGNEIWIIERNTYNKLIEKKVIFPAKYEEKMGMDIQGYFKIFKPYIQSNVQTRILSSDVNPDDEKYVNKDQKLEIEIIDHDDIVGKIPKCNYCDKKVRKKRHNAIFLTVEQLNVRIHPKSIEKDIHKKSIMISKEFKNYPRLPILECEKCGRIEFGKEEKECQCGGKMVLKYSYDPNILPVGIYAFSNSIKNKIKIDHKKIKTISLLINFISATKINYIEDLYINYVSSDKINIMETDPELFRIASASKKSGSINEADIDKADKIRSYIDNVFRMVNIYGVRKNLNIIDEWILSKAEKLKKSMFENYENFNILNIVKDYYNFVEEFSKKYIKLIRNDLINKDVMQEFISISYPFFPNTIIEYLSKNELFDISRIERGKYMVNEALENLIDLIFKFDLEIKKLKRKNEWEYSKPLKKIIIEAPIKYNPILVGMKVHLKRYLNTLDIEITDSWKGKEYKIILNRDKIGEIYKPLANTLELILSKLDAKKIKNEIETHGYNVGVEGQLITITPSMVKFEYQLPENYYYFEFGEFKFYIDMNDDDILEEERIFKKLSRRIAFMKYQLNVEYDDIIRVSLTNSMYLKNIIDKRKDQFLKDLKIAELYFSDQIIESLVRTFDDIMEGDIEIGITPLFAKYKIKALSKLPSLTIQDAERLFNMGYRTIDDIKNADMKEISDKTGISINKIKVVKDYLSNVKMFHIIKSDEKSFCPMCDTELMNQEPFCPKCNVPLSWD